MLIRNPADWELREGDATPEAVYMRRREILLGMAAAGLLPASAAAQNIPTPKLETRQTFATPGEDLTSDEDITHYNNFYEFGTDKLDPSKNAGRLETSPWTLKVTGLVKKPRVYDIDRLIRELPLEERIYRLRCVEAWSMVIPWVGVSLSHIINHVEPLGSAKYVAFKTLYDPRQMPGQRGAVLDWPYVEGLRLDEARHPLALLSVGLYGRTLLPQNGAPVRLVVPWKYGFKSIKSIVEIRFTERQPPTSWNRANPQEYGFYSNVNPDVDHPRWSQGRERRIGEFARRKTLMFNGYGSAVAPLYAGMDLKRYY